ncbi:hypothetical protein, partial [Citrobacter sp. VF227]
GWPFREIGEARSILRPTGFVGRAAGVACRVGGAVHARGAPSYGSVKRDSPWRSEQITRQPDDHHSTEDAEGDAEPEETPLAAFRGAIGVFRQGHAAVAAFGVPRRIVLLAVQALGHVVLLLASKA